jgi:hypothetical protein
VTTLSENVMTKSVSRRALVRNSLAATLLAAAPVLAAARLSAAPVGRKRLYLKGEFYTMGEKVGHIGKSVGRSDIKY